MLNETIEETLPDIDVVKGDEITIRQRLEMRSGLGVADINGAIGHNGNYYDLYTAMVCRYEDFVVLSNGQDEGGTMNSTAENVFWNFVEDIGIYNPGSGNGTE